MFMFFSLYTFIDAAEKDIYKSEIIKIITKIITYFAKKWLETLKQWLKIYVCVVIKKHFTLVLVNIAQYIDRTYHM